MVRVTAKEVLMKTRGQRVHVSVDIRSEIPVIALKERRHLGGFENQAQNLGIYRDRKKVVQSGFVTFSHTNGSREVEITFLPYKKGANSHAEVLDAIRTKTDFCHMCDIHGLYDIIETVPHASKMLVRIAKPNLNFTSFVVEMIVAFSRSGYCPGEAYCDLKTENWDPRDFAWEYNTSEGWFTHEKWIERQIKKAIGR